MVLNHKSNKNKIPFKSNLLFDFWSAKSKSTLTSTYLLDTIHNIKLYPVKSNNIVTTSVNTQFHVPKEYVDYTLGFTISMDIYYNPSTHDMTRYNSICGRGNNTGFHSGMYVPGLLVGNNFAGNWRSQGTFSTISTTNLTADWYRFSLIVSPTQYYITLLNMRTNNLLTGSTQNVGTTSNSDNYNFTFLSYGIEAYTGAYGSVGLNVSNITISRGSTCLLSVPLSSGADTSVVDICNKVRYTLGFLTSSIGWTKLANYSHANFYYGYTLYTKSGSPNLYICNATDGSEISITPPSGYTRIANYGPSETAFNGAENLFKFDNVSTSSNLYLADIDHVLFTDGTGVAKEFNITTFDTDIGYNRGYMYFNKTLYNNFLMYASDNTILKDIKIVKYIGYTSRIIYDEDGSIVFDEDSHAVLS